MSPVLLGMVLWLAPTVVVLVVLAVVRALDHLRRAPAPLARTAGTGPLHRVRGA